MCRRCQTAASLAGFINGAIRNSDQRQMAELLRRKSQVVVAFGVCAQLGGIPGLANLSDAKDIFARSSTVATRPNGIRNQRLRVDPAPIRR